MHSEKDYPLYLSGNCYAHLGGGRYCCKRSISGVYTSDTHCVTIHHSGYTDALYWIDFSPKRDSGIAANRQKGYSTVSVGRFVSTILVFYLRDLYLPKFRFSHNSRSVAEYTTRISTYFCFCVVARKSNAKQYHRYPAFHRGYAYAIGNGRWAIGNG